jgi:hypothetical protein
MILNVLNSNFSQRSSVRRLNSFLITAYKDGSSMSNCDGSAMCDHNPEAKNKPLPAASVEKASFACRK